MISLRRSFSPSSSSTAATGYSDASLPNSSGPNLPRRRLLPSQQQALKTMFLVKSHPSKEERVALAHEIGMELKAVNVWFQNRRQTAKKNATKENALAQRDSSRRARSVQCISLDKPRPLGSTVSLDRIAQLYERPTTTELSATQYSPRDSPRTPQLTKQAPSPTIDKLELWEHMPSSPLDSPTSPELDTARLSILPPRSRSMRSLEWACAKARVYSKDEEVIGFLPSLYEGDTDTDVEVEEAITPNNSADLSLIFPELPIQVRKPYDSEKKFVRDRFDDVEAAMVLLDFMGRR